jgi:hypothetical protein
MPGLANDITYNGLWAAQDVVTPVAMGIRTQTSTLSPRRSSADPVQLWAETSGSKWSSPTCSTGVRTFTTICWPGSKTNSAS